MNECLSDTNVHHQGIRKEKNTKSISFFLNLMDFSTKKKRFKKYKKNIQTSTKNGEHIYLLKKRKYEKINIHMKNT